MSRSLNSIESSLLYRTVSYVLRCESHEIASPDRHFSTPPCSTLSTSTSAPTSSALLYHSRPRSQSRSVAQALLRTICETVYSASNCSRSIDQRYLVALAPQMASPAVPFHTLKIALDHRYHKQLRHLVWVVRGYGGDPGGVAFAGAEVLRGA